MWLKLMRYLGSFLSSLGFLKTFFKWLSAGTLFEFVGRAVVRWLLMWAIGGAFFKAVNLIFMTICFYLVIEVLSGWVLDDLIDFVFAGISQLPRPVTCAVSMLGLYECFKIIVSACSSVGTVKLLLRLVLR